VVVPKTPGRRRGRGRLDEGMRAQLYLPANTAASIDDNSSAGQRDTLGGVNVTGDTNGQEDGRFEEEIKPVVFLDGCLGWGAIVSVRWGIGEPVVAYLDGRGRRCDDMSQYLSVPGRWWLSDKVQRDMRVMTTFVI